MKTITYVICDAGDGSQFLQWTRSEEVLARWEDLAMEGDWCYASGDGLQARTLRFPDNFDLDSWLKENYIHEVTQPEGN